MPEGSQKLGTRTEIKNLNSFKFIKKAIEYEVERQAEVLNSGGKVVQETRRFDESSGETFSMRSKEDAHDYRYFPDPDILPLALTDADIERIKDSLTEPPSARFMRYIGYGVGAVDADVILENKTVADFYDECVALGANPIAALNAVKGELLRHYNAESGNGIPILARELVRALSLAEKNEITGNGLKAAIKGMFTERKPLDTVLKEQNLIVKEDIALIRETVKQVLSENPKAVGQYRDGDTKVVGFFMGQCSRRLKGVALAQTIQSVLIEELGKVEN
jgi:aspartyl-tRNA(Asn)/glutamyl-tRNA(Gln) amidotransferase subunit B